MYVISAIRTRALAAATGAVLILAPALAASPVQAAGLMQVNVCQDLSTGKPAPASGWTTYARVPRGYYDAVPCNDAEGSYMYANFQAVAHSFGEETGITFTPPADTTIEGFSLSRWDQAGATQPYGTPEAQIWAGETLEDNCDQATGCTGEGSTTSAAGSTVSASSLSARSLRMDVVCGGGSGGECPAAPTEMRLLGGEITLHDSAIPHISKVSGALMSTSPVSGPVAVDYEANDAGTGVYAGTILVDGAAMVSQVPNSNGGECESLRTEANKAHVFNYIQPCPASVSGRLVLETTELTDGTHTVEVIVESAAGEQTIAYEGTLTVNNAPVATSPLTDELKGLEGGAPRYNVDDPSENFLKAATLATFTAPAGAGNITTQSFWERCNAAGEACSPIASATGSTYTFTPSDIGHSIRYATTATDKDGSTTVMSSATPEIKEYVPPSHSEGGTESPLTGPIGSTTINSSSTTTNSSANTSGSSFPPAVIQMTGLAAKWLHYGRGITRNYNKSGLKITGRLLSPSGAPLAGQTVYLESGPLGGALHIIEHAVSGSNGYWSMRAPRGSSRLLKVIYGPQDATAAGTQVTRNLVEHVRPGIRFHVSSVGAGLLIFHAQVAFGQTAPPLLAIVQAKGMHGWQDVGSPHRVGKHGAWSTRYSAATLIGHRYTFRLYVPATHMALSASSRPITATVN